MQLDGQGCSTTRYPRRLSLAFAALLGFAAADTATAEPYSVEDAATRHQAAPIVQFTPDGTGVVVQRQGLASENYGYRSKLFWFDLRGDGDGRALFSHPEGAEAEEEGYSWLSPSPDGRYAAYLHHHGDSSNAAVYDFRSHRSIEFDAVPDETPRWTWISDHEVVFVRISPRASSLAFPAQMSLQWRKMQEGSSTTASAMGSGRYAARPEDNVDEGFAVADVKTGAIRSIGHGRFLDQAVSTDGARVAAIRRLPAVVNPQSPIWTPQAPSWIVSAERGPLVVFDVNQDRARHETSHLPEALSGSLRWSPSGKQLAFLTAADNGSGSGEQLWIYDAVNRSARRLNLSELSASPSDVMRQGVKWRRPTAFAWLGEELAILAQTRVPTRAQVKNAAASSDAARADWFLLRSGVAPINLTAQLSQVPEVVAVTRESLLMSADGQVWEVRANRKPRLLAGDLGQRVRVASDPTVAFESMIAPVTSSLVLESESSQGPKTFYFLDVASGRITGRVSAPTQNVSIRAISTAFKRVAFHYSQDNVDVIAVADAGGASRDILRLNEFKKDREIGTFVEVDHKSKNGQKLISWLLLPPGYRRGVPLPTVVDIYPGMAYGSTAPERGGGADRDPLLAAHGYAVLLASLPGDYSVLPREPLQGLADAVLSAVDAAVSQGYVDGDRIALQGRSYGGYGTLGVIGQTDRFKAAVAVAGAFDLLSAYGQPRISDRLTGEFDGILDTPHAMGWSETGQGGMGAPPWRDPQRYLRNSPLLHVDTIHTPVMLVHGDLDSTVPFTQAEEMFTALYRLNKDAVFVRYWGEGHGVPITPANIRDYWARVYAWYDTHIGPPFDVARALATSH